jgi:hypothetical protein
MDWRYDSSGRALALQLQSHEFKKPRSTKKKKEKKERRRRK